MYLQRGEMWTKTRGKTEGEHHVQGTTVAASSWEKEVEHSLPQTSGGINPAYTLISTSNL